jgi:glycosyltransferase involved in cell wall biosynthesis
MVSAPKVSLHMTVFNTERYVAQAVQSILEQTYPDFDLVLWNDGSTDRSGEILQSLAAGDSRVQFHSSSHLGVAAAHAQAIAASQGQYIGWIDSDDLLDPTALAETVSALDGDSGACMVYTDYFDMDERGEQTRLGQRCQVPYSKDRLLIDFMTFHFRLLRRSAFDAVGGMNVEQQSGAEDYDLCLRLSEYGEILRHPKPLYYYRCRPGSFSHSQRLDQINASEQAVRRALIRRGMSNTHELSVFISAHFRLRKKPVQSDAGSSSGQAE